MNNEEGQNMSRMLDLITQDVNGCRLCGAEYGNSAVGFGNPHNPMYFFVGMNPFVRDHKYRNGRDMTLLLDWLKRIDIDDFFFDNIVKCQMPNSEVTCNRHHAENCVKYFQRQINLIEPKCLIIFGRFVSESLGFEYVPWTQIAYPSISVWIVPHFSSFLYSDDADDYYRNLFDVLMKAKRSIY